MKRIEKRAGARRAFAGLAAFSLIAGCAAPPQSTATLRLAQAQGATSDATDFNCPTVDPMFERSRASVMTRRLTGIAPPAPPPPPPPPAPPPAPGWSPSVAGTTAADAAKAVAPSRFPAPSPMPIPAPTDTERHQESKINGVARVAEQPVSTFAMEVDTASYANVRRHLNEGRRPPAAAVRVEEMLNYFDYAYPRPRERGAPFSTSVAVAPSPWSPGKQLIHVGLRGYDVTAATRPRLNLTLLMDVSGSMASADRLPLAKRAMTMLAGRLSARDRVAIVVYAGAAGVVLPPTPGDRTRDIVCALEALQAGGSTAGGQGIRLAYDLATQNRDPKGVNRVILMTDGDFNVGITDPDALKDFVADQRAKGIHLSVFGFGRGNLNDRLMQALAQNGNGVAAYVDTIGEARRLLDEQIAGTLFPIADDVKAQIEFNPARVAEWRLIGYETRALAREDFNNDAVDAGEIGSGHQVTALWEITPVGAPGAVDPLRYERRETRAGATDTAGEIAHLRLRYKLPGQSASRLIERPVTDADVSPDFARAPEATRWAAGVAAFGQILRRDPWIGAGFGLEDVARLAESVRLPDPHGQRAEFIALARRAQGLERLPPVNPPQGGE
jgi:Ca-activated chloride channel family protein